MSIREKYSLKIKNRKIACIIPAYKVSVVEINKLLSILPKNFIPPLIAYNDSDSMLIKHLKYLERNGYLLLFQLPYQVGKAEVMRQSIKFLLSISDADIIVQTDAHLKQPPEKLTNIVECLLETNSHMIVANRYGNQFLEDQEHRRAVSTCLSKIIKKITGYNLVDTVCGTRAYTRELARSFSQLNSFGYGLEMEQILIAAKHGLRVGECIVNSNRQSDTTNSEKIEDNFYTLISYCGSLEISDDIRAILCHILANVKKRVTFSVDMSLFNIPGIIAFNYVGGTGEHIAAYTSGLATDGYRLSIDKETKNAPH